jgi:4'-phosphopantetheinyl transferase
MTADDIQLSWEPARRLRPLKPGALHLWKITCGGGGPPLARLWPLLSPREDARARRLRQESHRERYVRAHGGLRLILSRYLDQAPRDLVFSYGANGKPHLGCGLEFNLTTSADLALVAVCLEQPVGVDCELVRPRVNPLALARRMFDETEARRVADAPPGRRLDVFTRSWTALEASVKADGRGLFRSRVEPPMPALAIGHCVPEPGYLAAVAREGLPPAADWHNVLLD